jgi:hypothetical protein
MLISQVKLINMRGFASYSKHEKGIQAILIIINHDYDVVIGPYSYHHIIMKLIILCLNTANKPSPMSEGVTEIWINNQPCKGINLTTRHTQARRAPWVATIHDVTKNWAGSYLALVSSSTPMPRRTHRGWPEHYPIIHPWSEVRYRPTPRHMKLLSLGISYVPYASVYSNACSTGLNQRRP